MFLVFLEGDLPGMLVLFLCGIIGWFVTKHVNRRYSSMVQIKAKAKTLENEFCEDVQSPVKSNQKARKRSNRSKNESTSPMHGKTDETKPASFQTPDDADKVAPVEVENEINRDESSTPKETIDARTAKIMAKKAERKARKMQEQKSLQAEEDLYAEHTTKAMHEEQERTTLALLASYDVLEVLGQKSEACLSESGSGLVPHAEDNDLPRDLAQAPADAIEDHGESDKASLGTEDVQCDSTTDDDQPSCDSDIAAQKLMLPSPSAHSAKVTSCGSSDFTPSEDGIGVEAETDGYSTSDDVWQPSQAVTQPPLVVTSPVARGHSGTGEEIWFEPVKQNEDGTQIYTDGQQLYQAVCVRVEDLVQGDGAYQINVASPHALQSLPTGATFFQSVPTENNFQHLPSDVNFEHQATDISYAMADGPCFQQVPSDGIEDSHFGNGSFHYTIAPESFDDNYVDDHQDLDYMVSTKKVSPTFQDDEEDALWNMCWDFVSSSWSP